MRERLKLVTGLGMAVAVGWTSVGACGQTPGAGQPAARVEKRDRGWVSVSERIAMGVPEPTWVKEHGKVHPDVQRALAYQKGLEANLEKAPDWIDVVDTEGPEAFLGYTYVVVHLEYSPKEKPASEANRAAIRKLEDSVLSSLTAVDFRYWLRFPERPAIIGFVNEGGLKKLAGNKDVRAIGLDDKPYPQLHQAQFYQEGSDAVNGAVPKVSPQVAAALDKEDEVHVWVAVRAQDSEEERTVESFKRGRGLNDKVLAHLSAQEFNVTSLSDVVPHFRGWVSRAGLTKLGKDPDVRNVGLPTQPPRTDGQGRKRP
jgi:hypothetical protein